MKELTTKQVEEVSGGNPALAILAVLAGRAAVRYATPYIKKALIGAAVYIGGDEGYRAAS